MIKVLGSCLLSAVVLTLSFPRSEWSCLAWVALVPLFCVLDGQNPARAFRRSYLCGILFFAVIFGWIAYVTIIGIVFLAAFLALYFALFGLMFVYFQRLPVIPRIFVLSAGWVALEFIRAHLFTGFGWALLGHSQYKNLWLIQIADKTGIEGISFLVMLVNLTVFENWRSRTFLLKANITVAVLLSLVLLYGFKTLNAKYDYRTVKVGVVQPNIPLDYDWDDSRKPWIVAKTIELSKPLADQKPDLIVWPETSLPGVITDSPFMTYEIRSFATTINTPIMLGSVAQEGEHYYNSAFLIGSDGQMLGRYDKIHLVPYGEYLPLRPILGWINRFVELDDFTPGKTYKIFSIGPTHKKFGVLICFEDALEGLCRHLALAGADFFVNMTNDAWFLQTRAPFLHLQGAVFGCVENHRSLARAANTGISALVDPWGRITTEAHNIYGQRLFVEASALGNLPLVPEKTFYTKYGDIFTMACFLCILVAALVKV